MLADFGRYQIRDLSKAVLHLASAIAAFILLSPQFHFDSFKRTSVGVGDFSSQLRGA